MSSRFDRRGLLRTAAILTAGTVQAAPAAGQVAENTDQARRCTIKVVQTFLLRHELQQPFGVSVSVPLDKTRETLLVRIEGSGIVLMSYRTADSAKANRIRWNLPKRCATEQARTPTEITVRVLEISVHLISWHYSSDQPLRSAHRL